LSLTRSPPGVDQPSVCPILLENTMNNLQFFRFGRLCLKARAFVNILRCSVVTSLICTGAACRTDQAPGSVPTVINTSTRPDTTERQRDTLERVEATDAECDGGCLLGWDCVRNNWGAGHNCLKRCAPDGGCPSGLKCNAVVRKDGSISTGFTDAVPDGYCLNAWF
jgi:hypothetical protein